MFSTLVVSRKRYPRASLLDWKRSRAWGIRRSCLNLLVTFHDWLDDVLDVFADTVRRRPSYCCVTASVVFVASIWASSRPPQTSYCHGFLLAVMYNHRGLEQYHACEDLSPLFNDKTSLEMRTWCIHKETLNEMTKWGSFLIPLAVSDRVVRLQNKREKNKLD